MKYYSDLGAALTAMDIDRFNNRGRADIMSVERDVTDYEMYVPDAEGEKIVAAQAVFYPDHIDYMADVSQTDLESYHSDQAREISQYDECGVSPDSQVTSDDSQSVTASAQTANVSASKLKDMVANASAPKLLGALYLGSKFLPTNVVLAAAALAFYVRSEKNKSLTEMAADIQKAAAPVGHLG